MDEKFERIKKHMWECFVHIRSTISLEELYEYKKYIIDEEVVIPCLRENISFQLEELRQRVEALTDLIEGEEKRRGRKEE